MRGTVVVAAALAAGCYSPAPPTGAPCADGVCPRPLVCSPATDTCETTAIGIDAFHDGPGIDAPDDAAIDAGIDAPASQYAYRRRITITNASGTTMPAGYTIRVPLPLGMLVANGKARSDLADVRVIGDGAVGERDRIIDAPGGPAPAAIHFSLATSLAPAQATSVYAIYYGRPMAGAAPRNGDAVFHIYDDFASAIGPEWARNDDPQVVAGKLVLRANHTDAIRTTAATDGLPITSAVELVANVVDPGSEPTTPNANGTFYYWFGYQHTADFVESDPWIVWIARGKFGIGAEQKSPVGCEAGCGNAPGTQDTQPHYYQIERDPNGTRFYRDGTLVYTANVQNTQDYALMVRNFLATSAVEIDYVRARPRVFPDPIVSLAAEEAL